MLDLVMLREFVDTSLLISRSLQDKSQRVEGGGGKVPLLYTFYNDEWCSFTLPRLQLYLLTAVHSLFLKYE